MPESGCRFLCTLLPQRRWTGTFYGLSAALFCLFALDEITQAATFVGGFLTNTLSVQPADGFHDMEAVLLTLLFLGAGMALLPRTLDLLRHPRASALFVVAALLGALSQGLDSFAPATRWEFVAEETLKLSAEAFFLGAFLSALCDLTARRREAAQPPGR